MSEQAQPLFDLTLSDEQALMRETVRRFAANEMRASSRKADEAGAAPADFYAKSAELGFNMVPIAEELGGIGAPRSPVSNMLIAEDLAYGDMSLAIGALSTLSFINTRDRRRHAGATQAAAAAVHARGTSRRAAVAFMEPGLRFDPLKLQTEARKDGARLRAAGEKTMVPLGGSAEAMLVIADEEGVGAGGVRDREGPGRRERRARVVHGAASARAVQGQARRREGRGERNGSARPSKPFDLRRFVDLSRIGSGALALGVGQAVLDYVKQYCNERVAFGEPITQPPGGRVHDRRHRDRARRHALARVPRRGARRARPATSIARRISRAVQCAEKGMKIGTDGVQLLGGHGFIREHMVELWYRNLRALGILEGCVTV